MTAQVRWASSRVMVSVPEVPSSVGSPNPINRNPSYEPLINPDRAIRDGELQYVVWDTFSAARAAGFSERLLDYVDRYDGRIVHTEVLPARTALGERVDRPGIVVFQVRP